MTSVQSPRKIKELGTKLQQSKINDENEVSFVFFFKFSLKIFVNSYNAKLGVDFLKCFSFSFARKTCIICQYMGIFQYMPVK